MTGTLAAAGLSFMLVLCRTGSFLMLIPGFGSFRVPVRVRIWFAVAATLAVYPVVYQNLFTIVRETAEAKILIMMIREAIIGITMGLLVRFYMIALQFAANLLTSSIGLAATPGAPIDDTEPMPPLVNLVSMSAGAMIFMSGLHYDLLAGLFSSYQLLPIGQELSPEWLLNKLITNLDTTSNMGLRLASPFIVYSVVVNLAIGLANKFTPQISIYFMTTGVVAAGGLLLFYFIAGDWFTLFLQDFAAMEW